MANQDNVQKLIEDLMFVKTSITKNGNIFKYINISRRLSQVALAGGILVTLFSAAFYALILSYGNWPEVPATIQRGSVLGILLFTVFFTCAKIFVILGQLRQTRQNMTVLRLFKEVYTPQTLTIIIPFMTAIAGITVFLVTQGHILYIIPALSILVGLICIAYVNIFWVKELVVTGDWLLAAGLITLFTAETLHPLLALILTFGLGLTSMYVANRIMER